MRPRITSERNFKQQLLQAEVQFVDAKEYLANCEEAAQTVGGKELMKARQQWANAAANYSSALRAYGQYLIESQRQE